MKNSHPERQPTDPEAQAQPHGRTENRNVEDPDFGRHRPASRES